MYSYVFISLCTFSPDYMCPVIETNVIYLNIQVVHLRRNGYKLAVYY